MKSLINKDFLKKSIIYNKTGITVICLSAVAPDLEKSE